MDKVKEAELRITTSPDFYIFTSYVWSSLEDNKMPTGEHSFLPYHRDRLVSAAQAFGWHDVVRFLSGDMGLQRLFTTVDQHLKSLPDTERTTLVKKIKVCVYKDVRFSVESASLSSKGPTNVMSVPTSLSKSALPSSRCTVKLDSEPIIGSLFTSHKTSERRQYDGARRRAGIIHEPPTIAEVLLFNPQKELTECSLSTPYFLRNGRWITPPASSGGLAGVIRRLALERGLCEEHVLHVEDLNHGEQIWISNGVRGFIPAILCLESAA